VVAKTIESYWAHNRKYGQGTCRGKTVAQLELSLNTHSGRLDSYWATAQMMVAAEPGMQIHATIKDLALSRRHSMRGLGHCLDNRTFHY